MAHRRTFLTALGLGIGSLGLPGLAQAFGLRRRHGSCPPPCAEAACPTCPTFFDQRITSNEICPITKSLYNGVWYYGAADCRTSPPTNCSFHSSTELTVPAYCGTGNSNCIPAPAYGPTSISKSYKVPKHGRVPHYKHGSPRLPRKLRPGDPVAIQNPTTDGE